uniref:Uncharacterized protein n=1 Tax=Arundo donax TaxID=35708 RepID=A0A0A9BQK4_ARUDO
MSAFTLELLSIIISVSSGVPAMSYCSLLSAPN